MIKHSRKECTEISRTIENEFRKRWGVTIKFKLSQEGEWSWVLVSGADQYDKYPGMSKEEADQQLIRDIDKLIRSYLPGRSTQYTTKDGTVHYLV